MRSLFEDLRYAIRVLRGNPGFTAVSVLTLALGIAANATVFGWIDSLLLRPYPGAAEGRRLALIESTSPNGEYSTTSYRDYRDYRDRLQSFSGVAASLYNVFSIGPVDNPRRVSGEYVSANYFAVLGVAPVRGRGFLPSDASDSVGASPAVVIGSRLWRDLFQSDPAIVGKTIGVNRHQLTVVGVAPQEFRGTMPGMLLEIWIPINMAPMLNGQGDWLLQDRGARQMWVTARLKPGVGLQPANSEVEAAAQRLAEESPDINRGFGAKAMPVWKGHVGVQSILLRPLQILMAVCVLLFLIVGANVASLQLAHATARRREVSVRMALGAGPWRLMRQFLSESMLLALAGAFAGMLLAGWLGQTLLWMLPAIGFPLQFDFRLNADTLAFTVLLCGAGALISGLTPALHSLRTRSLEALKEGGRSGTSGAAQNRTRALLVVSEVALALVALVGTALFVRTFQNARAIHPGFDAGNLLYTKYDLETFCSNVEQREQFCHRLHDRLSQLPGVSAVTFATAVPLQVGTGPWSDLQVEGYAPGPAEEMRVTSATVAPDYFAALRIPLLEGRDFTEQDARGKALVAMVNQAFARRYFGGGRPLGRKIRVGAGWSTVVGLVKDIKWHNVTEQPLPQVYTAYRQTHGGEFWTAFFIRTAGPARNSMAAVRREATAIDTNAGQAQVVGFDEIVAGSIYAQKVAAALLSVLGAASLLLAALGLYSVLAYTVSQREHEFGIRMALGAAPAAVLGMVLRRGLVLTLAGIAVGSVMAAVAIRLAAPLLVGVQSEELTAIGGAAMFLGAIAILASYLPARRATQADPMVMLREP